MAKRRGKAISFDAMVKFFMQHYDIPTKKDFEKLAAKMDRLEKLIKAAKTSGRRSRVSSGRVSTASLPSCFPRTNEARFLDDL